MKTIEPASGQDMHTLIRELYPFCRSITGNGVRQTLKVLQQHIPLSVREVPSGTPVFDWEVPREWNISDAYIANAQGERLVDFHASNLHVVNYSRPVHATMSLAELTPHLFSLPDRPDAIPYRTTYYEDTWGFCIRERDRSKFTDQTYEVRIDATLEPGSLTYGEYVIPGASERELVISTHICHPSMCNDNLSGIAVATFLAKLIAGQRPRYTHRFLFVPGTIGSLTWLATHPEERTRIKCGLVLTGVGDAGHVTYKRTRQGNSDIDLLMETVLKTRPSSSDIVDFYPYGYDERQYSAPGINLPFGTLMRTRHGTYPEYHTSLDNPDFVQAESLADSLSVAATLFATMDTAPVYRNKYPDGEPNLGKRGLYKAMNTVATDKAAFQLAMLWVLNMSDGSYSLPAIVQRSGIAPDIIESAAQSLLEHDIIEQLP